MVIYSRGPQLLVHGLALSHGMPENGPYKQVKPHQWNAGSIQNHAPSTPWKNLSLWNQSLVTKSFSSENWQITPLTGDFTVSFPCHAHQATPREPVSKHF
uniref:Uncharacterized protein n=1 Tax=Pseudonaja textilis TaxID=8673 RepID=A0A670Y252_PSETE